MSICQKSILDKRVMGKILRYLNFIQVLEEIRSIVMVILRLIYTVLTNLL